MSDAADFSGPSKKFVRAFPLDGAKANVVEPIRYMDQKPLLQVICPCEGK